MTDQEYLEEVLASQDLAEDSQELKELRDHRTEVERLLKDKFSESSPSIRYGGSKTKGTLIRECYDLDIVCYFESNDTKAGQTLEEIYSNVRDALKEQYDVQEKTSALRLRSKSPAIAISDFHIDVVPGRYVDDSKADCFIFQSQCEKERLKTNLQIHIDHIKNSGVVDAIRLMKLWKVRRGLNIKQFVFELLIIKLLLKKKDYPLVDQLRHVWGEIANSKQPITVEDPANPTGNDLMPALRGNTWNQLSAAAEETLRSLDNSGIRAIFVLLKSRNENSRVERLQAAAAAVSRPTKPWSR